ncbi:SOS response-associated peptidase family protein [Geopsychrobacter electrodiphilus]|uniref:SOS response-associated peptidase family protein n=1 Tax=Geopsychrobacter electrodiphilus TaxID=225196 RepID=UPI000A062B4A
MLADRTGDTNQRTAALIHWGPIPRWAKEKSVGYKMFNARFEACTEKPSFRSHLKQ